MQKDPWVTAVMKKAAGRATRCKVEHRLGIGRLGQDGATKEKGKCAGVREVEIAEQLPRRVRRGGTGARVTAERVEGNKKSGQVQTPARC